MNMPTCSKEYSQTSIPRKNSTLGYRTLYTVLWDTETLLLLHKQLIKEYAAAQRISTLKNVIWILKNGWQIWAYVWIFFLKQGCPKNGFLFVPFNSTHCYTVPSSVHLRGMSFEKVNSRINHYLSSLQTLQINIIVKIRLLSIQQNGS